ncbi:hypothetical protein [Leptolyngbya sp. FACHB-16]|uniref:hypothetical protein n=1 Tax=unclassified Leptolyngbya TaxID=2650499 RepID=UPI001682FD95|nr:hypothetical protein [Leptolyngbya sp. FACHB-16]MBD2156276.1 hypothetical protein [Leptolyngbya sp. FACHB-16]
MQLSEFPDVIATYQREIHYLSTSIARGLKSDLAEMEASIKHKVAFDSDLKNDRQRDACIAEFKAGNDYRSVQRELEKVQDRQAELEIELERVRGMFTAAKLEARERVALAELQTAFN